MMTTTNKTYEMLPLTNGRFIVRCLETGTETIELRKGQALRVFRALRKEG